jgi:hypothetical protein
MRKIVLANLLLAFASIVYASTNSLFEQFEDEFNIGYGLSQGTLINGAHNTALINTDYVSLEIERLFGNGVWLDANLSQVTSYNQPNLGRLNGGNGSMVAFGQNPFMYSLTFKGGYSFEVVANHLQLIPYAMLGRNTNWATSTIIANGYAPLVTRDYFYTGGLGGRLAYRIDSSVMLYLDQIYLYNWDNSGAIKYIQTAPYNYGKSYAATNYGFTTTLGAKYNVWKDLQLGLNLYWNNFQPQSNIAGVMYTPTNTYGVLGSVGFTY